MNPFEFAMQFEKDGEAYYRRLAGQTEDRGMKTILTMLADEEAKHYGIVEAMQAEAPAVPEAPLLADIKTIFAKMADAGHNVTDGASQVEVYRKAQQLEQQSIDFYADQARSDGPPAQQAAFTALAEEERKHYFVLGNIIAFVSRPDTWLAHAEYNHLEEY